MEGLDKHTRALIYIYTDIYKVVFKPVNPEKEIIPSGQFEYLHIPGKELYVNKFTEQIVFQEKKTIYGHIRIINLFPVC